MKEYIEIEDKIINTCEIENVCVELKLGTKYTVISMASGDRIYCDEKYYFKLHELLKPLNIQI